MPRTSKLIVLKHTEASSNLFENYCPVGIHREYMTFLCFELQRCCQMNNAIYKSSLSIPQKIRYNSPSSTLRCSVGGILYQHQECSNEKEGQFHHHCAVLKW
ncbi:hypothetical protein ACFX13_044959 [Malus domestica]